jgi:hypothetical protein
LVKLAQVWRRHHDVPHRRGLLVPIQRRRRALVAPAAQPQQDGLHVVARFATAHLNDTLHLVEGMVVEQLQDTHVLLDTAARAVLFLQGFPEFAEEGRQLPAAKDVGMIQRCRPVLQGPQVVVGIEDLLVVAVRTRMRGDHLAAQHDVEVVDGGFDANRLERRRPRHAVAVIVETHHLVLISLGGLKDAWVKRMPDQ